MKCFFCECGGTLVKITCTRSDTGEVLDSEYLCPECIRASEDLRYLFSPTVAASDPDSGVAYVRGRPAED